MVRRVVMNKKPKRNTAGDIVFNNKDFVAFYLLLSEGFIEFSKEKTTHSEDGFGHYLPGEVKIGHSKLLKKMYESLYNV